MEMETRKKEKDRHGDTPSALTTQFAEGNEKRRDIFGAFGGGGGGDGGGGDTDGDKKPAKKGKKSGMSLAHLFGESFYAARAAVQPPGMADATTALPPTPVVACVCVGMECNACMSIASACCLSCTRSDTTTTRYARMMCVRPPDCVQPPTTM